MVWDINSSGEYSSIGHGMSKASWIPNSYDHASLVECTRCTQGYTGLSVLDTDRGGDHDDDDGLGMELEEALVGCKMKKRKLTTEQATRLEASFETDNKLEGEKKQRLAAELGLQPRQVAVWFQNRRARLKTKQLEQDFLALKADYDMVLAQRRNLEAEIAGLAAQLQVKNSEAKTTSCSQDSTSSINSNNGDLISESTTLRFKLVQDSSTKDTAAFMANSSCEYKERDEECAAKVQDTPKCTYITGYEWEPYDNGLWVFD